MHKHGALQPEVAKERLSPRSAYAITGGIIAYFLLVIGGGVVALWS